MNAPHLVLWGHIQNVKQQINAIVVVMNAPIRVLWGHTYLCFLAALAALGLPWLLTQSINHCFIDCYGFKAFQPSRANPNLAKLMGVMKKHDLTSKKTTTKTKTKTNAKTKTNTMTFREYLQRAIFETFDLWDIWSGWWENMTWPTKRQRRRQRQWQRQWQIHLENTAKEQSLRLLTFETFDQSDNKTWPDPTKRQQQRQRQRPWRWQIHLESNPNGNEWFFEIFREHPRMAILEKVWVWPIVMNSVRPFQTKLIGVDQISHFRPNFTILE